MLWSFIAVFFSGWLYVDASYRGPAWQRWLFKPITLLLLLLLAWQAPMLNTLSYLVLAGVLVSMVGDALTLLPTQRLLYALSAFFLSHLLYTIWFASQMSFSFWWPVPLVLALFGALLLAILWSRLEALRLPVCASVGMALIMVWLAADLYFARPTDTRFSAFVGAALLLLSDSTGLFSQFRRRFPADRAIIAACYFAGHFLIVRSLYL